LFDKTPVGETDDLTDVAEILFQTQDIMMRRYTQYSESDMRYGHFSKFDEVKGATSFESVLPSF